MKLSVSLGYWQDRPPEEALLTAAAAERNGYEELWLGEMATYDVFALATAVGLRTGSIPLTVGPLAVAVRDPMTIARGAASVAALTGRRVDVAIGSSSPVVVEQWHGRSHRRSGVALRESATALRQLLDGERTTSEGEVVRTSGYRLRLPAPKSQLTVAAFGPAAVRTAAAFADRMVLNLLTPASAAKLVGRMREEAEALGRPSPRVAAWVTAAVDPSPEAVEQLRRGVVGYLAAPGYAEMFIEAGFGDVVEFARSRPHPRELLAAVPAELTAAVGLVGDLGAVRARLAEYAAAGVDEVAVVASSTDADPGGERTLALLRDR
ncbi:LLM class F420-dependent oxidoreductase [Streptomyces sp. SID13666]|uniref:LLM class F420-dependent oxidoreductase n=1 Tax=unclassified Streptomyces TaxID=2593676 RepID=UPI0013C00B78|nr:LLM class F420-dependent oxidoreductase [Streptomyces sp. H39-C1]MCZ4098822.1 LLM class F420-dependent oxidoreductase [Streptomyces sp. H39-C1]NEA58764.1 LLM class F420-dependent oxidoreductase [Streptomyces sp. SID13666]NEA70095.1 LLM class F420-dependent oxidoreductase [Streptomyces sp. SID13588]